MFKRNNERSTPPQKIPLMRRLLKPFRNDKGMTLVQALALAAMVIALLSYFYTGFNTNFGGWMGEIDNGMTAIFEQSSVDGGAGGSGGSGGEPGDTPVVPETPSNVIPEDGTYYVGVTATKTGIYTDYTEKYEAGDEFPATVSDGDVYVYGDYEYRYNKAYVDYFSSWRDSQFFNGWGVRVLDNSKSSYGSILENINGKPVTGMVGTYVRCELFNDASKIQIPNTVIYMDETFKACYNLTDLSHLIIPNTVTEMRETFEGCAYLEKVPALPDSVVEIPYIFYSCSMLSEVPEIPENVTNITGAFSGTKIKTAPIIPSKVESMQVLFLNCSELTGEVVINANPTYYDDCFKKTTQPITITGSTTLKAELAATANNGNVTY